MGKKKTSGGAKSKKSGGRRMSFDDDAMLNEVLMGSKTLAPIDRPEALGGIKESDVTPLASPSSSTTNNVDKDESLAALLQKAASGPSNSQIKCPHSKTHVKIAKIRKLIGHLKDLDHCSTCEVEAKKLKKLTKSMTDMSVIDPFIEAEYKRLVKGNKKENGEEDDEPLEEDTKFPGEALWMCLTCCDINCGRAIRKHAIGHHESKGESKDHPVAINLGSMDVWCYECDDQIIATNNRNQVIQEVQGLVERTLQIKHAKSRAASVAIAKKSKSTSASSGASGSTVLSSSKTPAIKIFTPGLQNLGNTCFFNSVVQVLTETRSIRYLISGSESKRQADQLQIFKKSLAAELETGLGPLTTTFKDFLATMWKQQGGTVTPKDLFTQIAKKWKVFRSYRQQDSQELMRYLFDGLRQEELDLIKRQEADGSDKEEGGSSSSESVAVALSTTKESQYAPFIESCFGGKLVSVIVCDACKKCTYAYEDFFDLSLPVKGASPVPSSSSSLKDRLRANGRLGAGTTSESSKTEEKKLAVKDTDPLIPLADQGSPQHLKHVEKVLRRMEMSTSTGLSIQRSLVQFTDVDVLEDENKFACENCYKLLNPTTVESESNEEKENKENTVDEVASEDTESLVNGSKTEEQDEEKEVEAEKEEDDEPEQVKTDRFGNTIPSTPKKLSSNNNSIKSGSTSTTAVEKSTTTALLKKEPTHIFRKAYKRYLISNLPSTLVLHLKRFEQTGSRFGLMRKIDEFVEIPEELDMAPYCIPANEIEKEDEEDEEDEETVTKVKQSTKYRLYGVTVHMGSLASGHYMNYVLSSKVEVPVIEKSMMEVAKGAVVEDVPLAVMLAQQQQKKKAAKQPTPSKAQAAAAAAAAATAATKNTSEDVEGQDKEEEEVKDTRQWIFCSDTNVRVASLKEALDSRGAYLLFYERV